MYIKNCFKNIYYVSVVIITWMLVSCPALDPKEINLKQDYTNISSNGIYDFGLIVADGDDNIASDYIDFTIQNLGTADLTINSISIAGTNKEDFDLDDSDIFNVIPPQDSTIFSVRFDPITAGEKTAKVIIENNDADEGKYLLTVIGTALTIEPEINIKQGVNDIIDETGSYNFGIIHPDGTGGETSGEVNFTIENLGNEDLEITDISLTAGGDTGDFNVNDTAASTVEAGGSTTFSVVFDPLSGGDKSVTIKIDSNDSDEAEYTFLLTGRGYIQFENSIQKIFAFDAQANDQFGFSVDVSGDYVIVGNPNERGGDGDPIGNAGAAYIYYRTGTNTWDSVYKISAYDAQYNDHFGMSVSIDGDYVIVGAYGEDGGLGDPISNTGAVYIFHRTGTNTWDTGYKITAYEAQVSDYFGMNVSISGDYAIVGAYGEDGGGGNPLSLAGAAYIYHRTGINTWDSVYKITAPDAQERDYFSYSAVSIDGDYAIVGAYQEDGGPGDPLDRTGAAYIYRRTGTNIWDSGYKIVAPDAQASDYFGRSVSIDGDYAIVGAWHEDGGAGDPAEDAGAAYIYHRTGTNTWNTGFRIDAFDAQTDDWFGASVSIYGDYAIVGAYAEEGGPGDPESFAGAAYIFNRTGTNEWVPGQKIYAPDAQASDYFGISVAIDGEYIIVGASGEAGGEGDPLYDAGAAYIIY